ncbi:hypothetical protein SprV_0802470900 [Sparganum proliferum]
MALINSVGPHTNTTKTEQLENLEIFWYNRKLSASGRLYSTSSGPIHPTDIRKACSNLPLIVTLTPRDRSYATRNSSKARCSRFLMLSPHFNLKRSVDAHGGTLCIRCLLVERYISLTANTRKLTSAELDFL